jgi:folate-binding protein YgfZ
MSAVPTGVAASDLSLLWVTGADANSFLQGLITQDVLLPEGAVTRSFLLEPRGKIRALMWVLNGDDRVGLITNESEVVAETLRMYKIRIKAEVSEDPRQVLMEFGADSEWEWEWKEADGVLTAGAGRVRLLVGSQEAVSLSAAQALQARILMGEPLIGADLNEKSMVHETPLVGATVSFDKGCYLGQELVSRIETRGRSPQRIVGLQGDGTPPSTGASVTLEGRDTGRVTSVMAQGTGFIALGMVRGEVSDGTQVLVDGVAATVVKLPFDEVTTA